VGLTVHLHRVYGLTVEAPFPLPGVPVIADPRRADEVDVTITWTSTSAAALRCPNVTHPAEHPTAPEIGTTAAGDTCLAWAGELMFRFSADLRHIHAHSAPAMLEYIPTVTVGLVLGVLLQRKGVLCLHGAALAWHGQAVAVLGPSGAGKSTLSAALVRRGATLLTDDVIALRQTPRGPAVEVGCLGIRLLPDAVEHAGMDGMGLGHVPYIDKRLWDLSGRAAEMAVADPTPLRAIYMLQPAEDAAGPLQVAALTPQQALRPLVPNWYPPNLMKLMQAPDLGRLAALARTVPMHAVTYARSWDNLSALAALLTP
jgi:hypothetical protein